MPNNILFSFSDDGDESSPYESIIVQAINGATTYLDIDDKEISISLVDADEIQTLNNRFRGKDNPTNVLSFPNSGAFLGDIVLCVDIITNEAREQEKSLEDHLTHLVVHSILHLIGYDHVNESDAEEMEALEIEILDSIFKIKNPYL